MNKKRTDFRKNRRGAVVFILPLLLFLGLSICVFASGNTEEDNSSRLKVVAGDSIIGDIVSVIAAEHVELTLLVGPDEDPHSFEPEPRDLIVLEEADIIFWNERMSILEQFSNAYWVSEDILTSEHDDHDEHAEDDDHDDHAEDDEHGDHDEHDHGDHGDIHVWFDPLNMVIWTESIRGILSEADPDNAADYERNAIQYIAALRALDEEIHDRLDALPRRGIVTDHIFFTDFISAYNLEFIGTLIPSVSDQAEPSPRHAADLIEKLQAHGGGIVLMDAGAPPSRRQLADEIAKEAGGNVSVVTILVDALAKPGSPGDTYVSFMRYNVEKLAEALGN